EQVFVVQSMGHKPDEYLMEYFLLVETLKDLGAEKVIGIIPYFAYARQDQRFKPGEALSIKTVSRLIEFVGTDKLYTIDCHRHRVKETEFSQIIKIPVEDLSAMPLLADYVKNNYSLENPVVIGPDAEAYEWARKAAEVLGCDYDVLEKKRITEREVVIRPCEINVSGRDVLIVDDIISTGGTMVEAIKVLKRERARRIIVACTHPLLVEDALAKIYSTGVFDVIGTDTVWSPVSVVSVAPLIATVIKRE
ncbi:MAG: ribose-phosphate pyrophosphokinase, partial [Thermoprotei archaeon]